MARPLTKLKPKRRWMQVSLRTVLVLVTLVCVALSMWVVPMERKRRAVAAIEALDGNVYYATSESFSAAFLRRWLPQVYFDDISDVAFTSPKVTDAGLVHLQGLSGLQQIYLVNTQVTDAGLARLQGLTNLQRLHLDNTQVSDAGLAYLQGMTSLLLLHLDNTQVTDAGVNKLRQALPNCQIMGP